MTVCGQLIGVLDGDLDAAAGVAPGQEVNNIHFNSPISETETELAFLKSRFQTDYNNIPVWICRDIYKHLFRNKIIPKFAEIKKRPLEAANLIIYFRCSASQS